MDMKNDIKNTQGFTLVEVLMVTVIFTIAITGMMRLFIFTSVQAEIVGNKTMAISDAQTKLEEIRKETFDDIVVNYGSGGTPGNTFPLNQINGLGTIYIDNSNAELLEIEVVVSWENKYGRIVGEDLDLDGVLDGGEDTDSNSKLSSPATLISMITRR